MSENQNQRKNFCKKKAGRTILVKVLNGDFKLENIKLEGINKIISLKNDNFNFITFDTVQFLIFLIF